MTCYDWGFRKILFDCSVEGRLGKGRGGVGRPRLRLLLWFKRRDDGYFWFPDSPLSTLPENILLLCLINSCCLKLS